MMGISIRHIGIIGLLQIKENIRSRFFYGLILGELLLFLFIYILGFMVTGAMQHTVQASCFWLVGIWGLVCSIVLGAGIVDREIQNRTHYMILARQVGRASFILGKFLSLVSTMISLFVPLTLVGLGYLKFNRIDIQFSHWVTLGFILLEWVVLAGFSLLMASFTSYLFHTIFLVGIYYLGHWSEAIYVFASKVDSFLLGKILLGIYYSIPNLELLNFRSFAIYDLPLGVKQLFYPFVTGALWIGLSLFLGIIIFNRRRIL